MIWHIDILCRDTHVVTGLLLIALDQNEIILVQIFIISASKRTHRWITVSIFISFDFLILFEFFKLTVILTFLLIRVDTKEINVGCYRLFIDKDQFLEVTAAPGDTEFL